MPINIIFNTPDKSPPEIIQRTWRINNNLKMLLVTGSRSIENYDVVAEVLSLICFDTLIVGDAGGVDFFAEEYALKKDIPIKEYEANWQKYGKRAGVYRNSDMVNFIQTETIAGGIAIWDGVSRGTLDCIRRLQKVSKLLGIFYVSMNAPNKHTIEYYPHICDHCNSMKRVHDVTNRSVNIYKPISYSCIDCYDTVYIK